MVQCAAKTMASAQTRPRLDTPSVPARPTAIGLVDQRPAAMAQRQRIEAIDR